MNEHVKLQVYVHDHEEIVIEEFKAKDWGDFLIIYMDAPGVEDREQYEEVMRAVEPIVESMGKKVIIIPSLWDVSFVGLRPVEEEDNG